MENSKHARLIAILIIIGTIASMFLIIIPILMEIVPDLATIFKTGDLNAAAEYINQFGILGIFLIFILQILQNVSIILPAPPIWTVAGITYGVWLGSLVCVVGMVVGCTIAFFIAKKVGNKLISMIIGEKKIKYLEFLENKHKSTLAIALLFLLPIFPSPLVAYLAARSEVSLRRFAIIVAASNIPSVLYFAFVGDQIVKGNFIVTIALFVVILLISILFLIFRKRIMAYTDTILSKKN